MKFAAIAFFFMSYLLSVTANDVKSNFILDTDSYKASHWMQYPEGTTSTFAYFESRGGKYRETLFFGLQHLLKKHFSQPITQEMVQEAEIFFKAHGLPFNYEGWSYIANALEGKLPIRIRAVAEGSLIPTSQVLLTVESTDPNTFWLPSWVETQIVRLWYPITVATISWHIKQTIQKYLDISSDEPEKEIEFKLHDFGSRGVSSRESAEIGGAAHLVNFKGSDTVVGVIGANNYYRSPMSAFSIPAAEHSTITSYGKENEIDAYRMMLKQFAKPGSTVAVVSDSYDLYYAVEHLWGEKLKKEIEESGATVIIRPDSGNPSEVVLKTITLLDKHFGHQVNTKGYKLLNHVRVVHGDGICLESIEEILDTLLEANYSASNVSFGMGGALLQKCDRDTQKFAYKCSSITVNGQQKDVYKAPVTDLGKISKKGRLDLIYEEGTFKTVESQDSTHSVLRTVFENGKILIDEDLEIIRKRASTRKP